MGLSQVEDEIRDMIRPKYVYVASSWRNPLHIAVCAALDAAGIDHYNFKDDGFGWHEVMPNYEAGSNSLVHEDEYLTALQHDRAHEGFIRDFEALERADTTICILPCGRSAHLELGYAVGQAQRTAILLDGPMVTPELMYKMVDYLAPDLISLLGWLGVED